jgi:hypothetical protein
MHATYIESQLLASKKGNHKLQKLFTDGALAPKKNEGTKPLIKESTQVPSALHSKKCSPTN